MGTHAYVLHIKKLNLRHQKFPYHSCTIKSLVQILALKVASNTRTFFGKYFICCIWAIIVQNYLQTSVEKNKLKTHLGTV